MTKPASASQKCDDAPGTGLHTSLVSPNFNNRGKVFSIGPNERFEEDVYAVVLHHKMQAAQWRMAIENAIAGLNGTDDTVSPIVKLYDRRSAIDHMTELLPDYDDSELWEAAEEYVRDNR